MSHEIEAKIKVAQLEPVAETLKTLGATPVHDIRQIDTYFMDADGLLAKNDCGLRIRQETIDGQQSTRMTFKGAKIGGPYKSRPEFETGVDDADITANIFESLGYTKRLQVCKHRSMWALDDCDVCLDEVERLGCFVEVEGPDETTIAGVLEKLNLHNAPLIKQGYASMTAEILKQENA